MTGTPAAPAHLRRRLLQSVAAATLSMLAPLARSAAPAATAPEPTDAVEPTAVLDLWPDGAPGGEAVTVEETVVERKDDMGLRDRAVQGVRRPTLTKFAAHGAARGSLLIVPGGGYKLVVVDKEGFETARWFAARGITCYVLLYRLPGDGWSAGPDAPLQDAQRALRMVRALAQADSIDPARVAVLGFSAGGHLAARLATRHAQVTYPAGDAIDALSARPDLAALMYPVIDLQGSEIHTGSRDYLLGPSPSGARLREYSAHADLMHDVPPSFLTHAGDDLAVPVSNSTLMYAALRAAGVPTEMHLFAEGGHGFGLRGLAGKPVAAWPQLLETWMHRQWSLPVRSSS